MRLGLPDDEDPTKLLGPNNQNNSALSMISQLSPEERPIKGEPRPADEIIKIVNKAKF